MIDLLKLHAQAARAWAAMKADHARMMRVAAQAEVARAPVRCQWCGAWGPSPCGNCGGSAAP